MPSPTQGDAAESNQDQQQYDAERLLELVDVAALAGNQRSANALASFRR